MIDCKFCDRQDIREEVMLPVKKLESGILYLLKDQTLPGRCILAYGKHVKKVTDLSHKEYRKFCDDAYIVAQALSLVYLPDKINYFIFGDISDHLHLHIVPKYKDKTEWGKMFVMDRENSFSFEDVEYQRLIVILQRKIDEIIEDSNEKN